MLVTVPAGGEPAANSVTLRHAWCRSGIVDTAASEHRPMEEVTRDFLDANQPLIRLAVALLLGSLIGIERGWVAREQKSGERIAGNRTHALRSEERRVGKECRARWWP